MKERLRAMATLRRPLVKVVCKENSYAAHLRRACAPPHHVFTLDPRGILDLSFLTTRPGLNVWSKCTDRVVSFARPMERIEATTLTLPTRRTFAILRFATAYLKHISSTNRASSASALSLLRLHEGEGRRSDSRRNESLGRYRKIEIKEEIILVTECGGAAFKLRMDPYGF